MPPLSNSYLDQGIMRVLDALTNRADAKAISDARMEVIKIPESFKVWMSPDTAEVYESIREEREDHAALAEALGTFIQKAARDVGMADWEDLRTDERREELEQSVPPALLEQHRRGGA